MSKPKVFVSRIIPDRGLAMLHDKIEMEIWQDPLPPAYEVLLKKVRGVDGLLCLLTDKIDPNLMDAAGPQLKVISQMAVGFDNINIPEATKRKLPVGNTPGVLTDTTADFAWALLMSAARRVVEGDKFTRAGKWQTWGPIDFLGPDVTGATLGLIGFGRIGQGLAKRAMGFDMRVLYYDVQRYPEAEKQFGAQFAELETVLHEADFISLHTILSPETYHFLNDDRFKLMKKSAIVINTSRGPVIDQAALYRALSTDVIAYAALDVTDPEPINMDDPLLTLDNIIIAPHIASASFETRNKMSAMAAANLLAGLNGDQLPNCVNPEVYT